MTDTCTGEESDFAFEPGPYTSRNILKPNELKALLNEMAAKGIRTMPFSFASAVAVASDIDSSRRVRYDAYVGALVKQYGLDFGDSTWLNWQYLDGQKTANAMGFFSRHFSLGLKEPRKFFTRTRTFNESIVEFHSGNVDHLHTFHARGPRVVVLNEIDRREDGRVEIRLKSLQDRGEWKCSDIFVFAVCVVGIPGMPIGVRSVTVTDRHSQVFAGYREMPCDVQPNGREQRLFMLFEPVDAESAAPHLRHVTRIVVEMDDPAHVAHVERVMLLNTHGDLIVDRLRVLRDRYKVELNLITDHSGQHIRNPPREKIVDGLMKSHIDAHREPVEAYNGKLVDDDGHVVYATDSDEPGSFARVFPELSRDQEFRFIVPHPASKADGYDPFELVTPSPTRSGGGIYWARRVLPNIRTPLPGKKWDAHSRQDTFARRIVRVLEQGAETPGLCWPVYTHLGSIFPAEIPADIDNGGDEAAAETDEHGLPSPYFDTRAMEMLQDHMFNISGTVPEGARTWFTRATVLYDYALMLKTAPAHVERPDGNTVVISSWVDRVLGKRFPRSPAQLYGLTFYVDNPAEGTVLLDGRPLNVVRNASDETGRPSVTIAEADIRYVLFDELDPRANAPEATSPSGGTWSWVARNGPNPPFGHFVVAPAAGEGRGFHAGSVGKMIVPLHGWSAPGAQLVTFNAMIDEKVSFGLFFRTRTGGTFYVGDGAIPAGFTRNATGVYYFTPQSRAPGVWHTFTIPFHDLAWAETARPGGPMPNHDLTSMMIVVVGPPGAGIRIGGLAFLRPRTIAERPELADRFCLAGSVQDAVEGQIVCLRREEPGEDSETRSGPVDQRGYFCFGCVPRGLYRIWSTLNGHELCDRRGMLIEVSSNVVNLVLSRRAAGVVGQHKDVAAAPESVSEPADGIDQPRDAA